MNDSQYKDQLIEMMKEHVLEFGSGILSRSTLRLLLLLQEKQNILFRLQEIKLLHGSKVDSDVAVFCKYTDVLVLMI